MCMHRDSNRTGKQSNRDRKTLCRSKSAQLQLTKGIEVCHCVDISMCTLEHDRNFDHYLPGGPAPAVHTD